jgi:hypothetical protein
MQDVLNEMIDDNILNTYRFKYTSLYFFFRDILLTYASVSVKKKKKKKQATDIHINSQTKSIDNILKNKTNDCTV